MDFESSKVFFYIEGSSRKLLGVPIDYDFFLKVLRRYLIFSSVHRCSDAF